MQCLCYSRRPRSGLRLEVRLEVPQKEAPGLCHIRTRAATRTSKPGHTWRLLVVLIKEAGCRR